MVGVGGLAGYYCWSHLDRVEHTQRLRMIHLSRASEIGIGEAEFSKIITRSTLVSPAHPAARRVAHVGQRIASAADQKDFRWEFVLIDNPEPNAFCLPGGKVGVFTGLLPLLGNDDELAAVLAHEIGHAVARHGVEKIGFAGLLVLVRFAVIFVVGFDLGVDLLLKLLADLPNSRRLEREADYIGLVLMSQACYDPRASPRVFETLGAYGKQRGTRLPSYLSTHPNDEDRVQQLQAWIPDVYPGYRDQCLGTWRQTATRWLNQHD